jgi:DUF1680 family protein
MSRLADWFRNTFAEDETSVIYTVEHSDGTESLVCMGKNTVRPKPTPNSNTFTEENDMTTEAPDPRDHWDDEHHEYGEYP